MTGDIMGILMGLYVQPTKFGVNSFNRQKNFVDIIYYMMPDSKRMYKIAPQKAVASRMGEVF
ncbi:MAG TPA: hypothetical protein PKD37_00495 [Oligoflexia bacterium]|nr:hypothetical protein [Oligoflexia bacterium]HMP26459.1 hypothetical protein [Oligoflexia bacterium]